MTRVLRLFLILSFVLTGFALASARGQAMLGDRVVLCSGQAIVLTYGPDGTPHESPSYCPDMALALLSATAPPPVVPVAKETAIPSQFHSAPPAAAGLHLVLAQARDPPVRSL